jgi:DNA-binding transcriptional LysR family regulator
VIERDQVRPHATGLWILTHSDMRQNPRVRAFMDYLGRRISRAKKRFMD